MEAVNAPNQEVRRTQIVMKAVVAAFCCVPFILAGTFGSRLAAGAGQSATMRLGLILGFILSILAAVVILIEAAAWLRRRPASSAPAEYSAIELAHLGGPMNVVPPAF